MVIKHGPLFEYILEKHIHYWNYDMFGKTTELKLHQSMKFRVSLLKFIVVNSLVAITLHSISPLFLESQILPQACWIPRNNPIAKNIIYILEITFYLECMFSLLVFDGLYLLMTSNLKSQFVLLQKAVNSIKLNYVEKKTTLTKLKKYSQYHSFLLR